MKPKVLGIAGSLRNARWGAGGEKLVADLATCRSEDDLRAYLTEQADMHLENFLHAGRSRDLPFDAIYENLKKKAGDKGLCNSEVALAAALWAAQQSGADIEHLSLAEYFPPASSPRNLDDLKARLRRAEGILVATPVYFGDRGSLAQGLVELIRDDALLRMDLSNRAYGGIAVGAKRNGGQETTLIYQLFDMVGLGMLGVGNDSDTTSQYGGTGHAGDVGTMARDEYGLWTCMGTGRRIAHVAGLLKLGRSNRLRGRARVLFLVLQDKQSRALNFLGRLSGRFEDSMQATILDLVGKHITRCIACDICPTHIDMDEKYRCIIKDKRDVMSALHETFLHHDAVIPVVYSPRDLEGTVSSYQRFVERTRYLRRGDYVFSDCLTAPLVLEDLGAAQNMHMRMATSMIRHHTVVTEPMNLYLRDGQELNAEEFEAKFERFLERTRLLTAGRLRFFVDTTTVQSTKYNPVGYVLSVEKDKENEKLHKRAEMVRKRHEHLTADAKARLASNRVPVS